MDAKLEPVLIVERMMDMNTVTDPHQVVYIGPTQFTVFKYAASSASDANIIFNNITPASLTSVLRRSLRVEMQAIVDVTTVGSGAGGTYGNQLWTMNAVSDITQGAGGDMPELVAGRKVVWQAAAKPGICLRSAPLQSVCSSIDLRINGGSSNVALDDYNLIQQFLTSKEDVRQYSSEMPFQPDNGAVYENQSITSPFNDTQGSFENARGGFVAHLISLTQAGGAANPMIARYSVTWTEQLLVSPFLCGKDQDNVGLTNVNNLTLSIRLNSLRNMLSVVPPATVGATAPVIAVSMSLPNSNYQPILVVEQNTQNSILVQRQPATAIYDYTQIQTYQTVVPAAGGQVTLAALRLPCLPKKLYIFVAPTYSARTPFVSDHFMRITNVSINFNDKSGLLASANESTLYEMSAFNSKSGYPTFNQYRFGCGSIIVIDCQKDLSVAESAQAGSASQFSTLQVQITCAPFNLVYAGAIAGGANSLAVPASYTAYQVIENPGLLYLTSSDAQFSVQGSSPAETLAVTAKGERLDEAVVDPQGAGFGSILASAFKHRNAIYDLGKKIASGGDVSGGMVSAGRLHRRA